MPDEPEKPQLRRAATNPWYVLMTIEGEQTSKHEGIDQGLHALTRRYWNRWQAQALSKEQKTKLVEDGRATEDDLARLTEDDQAKITKELNERCPRAVGEKLTGAKLQLTSFDKPALMTSFSRSVRAS